MKKIKYFFIIFIILIVSNQAKSSNNILSSLEEGGKIILIRHAYAPGNGDPRNFDINDCSTQRNLSYEGVNQSKKIGKFFSKNKIKIDKVLTSKWCRCKDTAFYAFSNYSTFNALNSFYSSEFSANKNKQILDLKNYIKNWNSKENLILITHYVVIAELLDIGVSSGEIIIFDKNYNLIGRIDTMKWRSR